MPGASISAFVTKVWNAPAALAFLCIGLVQAIVVTTLQCVVLVQWQAFGKPTILQVPRGYTVATNLGIFIFGFIFQLLFMCDALRLSSSAQAMLACVLNAGFLPFAIVQRKEIRQSIESLRGSTDVNGDSLVHLDMDIWPVVGNLTLAIACVVGVCTLLLVMSTWYLKNYFSWQSYRNVGADAKLRRMRITHQIFVMLAKMVIYFITCFHLVYGTTVLKAEGTEFIINMVLLGVAIAIICMSIKWSKAENRMGMIVAISAYLAGLAYFLYKIIFMYVDTKHWWRYSSSIESMTIFGCMAVVFIFMTTIFAIISMMNFWGGLKEHLEKHEESWDQQSHTKAFELDNIDSAYHSLPSVRDLDS